MPKTTLSPPDKAGATAHIAGPSDEYLAVTTTGSILAGADSFDELAQRVISAGANPYTDDVTIFSRVGIMGLSVVS